jgi:type II secretory pathway pseudopilin PulG
MTKKNINKTKNGYTIIETMISVSLFLIVVMIGMDSLLNAGVVSNKSQNMRSIMDNMNFVMEDMSRNLRTGYNYYCITGTDSVPAISAPKSGQNCWGIAFEPASGGIQWAYEIVSETSSTGATYYIRKSTDSGMTWVQLTPNEVIVDTTNSGFSISGAEAQNSDGSGDNQQPLVTIRLAGNIIYKKVTTPFSLQTSVSQRQIDI